MFATAVDGFGDIDDIVAEFLVLCVETAVGVANGVVVDAQFEGEEGREGNSLYRP